ncbi:hypothetical protein SASPL_119499 [Salvia splendens]|uniref:Uncharacterized protein n=1 Tax=Salvia splendens TaxID=180675 RepID=A0A8X8XMY4_SALSN|nr:hypothetical protein SASPL_119499 [Salvia splendens]
MLQRVTDVGDSTLTSLFIVGLKPALKQELLRRRPATLQDAFALAQQLAVCQAAASPVFSPKPSWQSRGNRTVQQPDPNAKKDIQPDQKQVREGQPPRDYPVKFYALMGVDDDDAELSLDNETTPEEDGENMAITGDVSRILVLCPRIKPRSIRLQGRVNGTEVSILIDGGSTHNFIQPAVAERLSLPVNAISPFRVFVGDNASLKCAFACLDTPINLQGHQFGIDLFVLQVKGPDIILGVQWLQDLGDITKNYRNLTMRFEWNDQPVFLRGEDAPPLPISYNNLFSLISTDSEADIFELLLVQSSALQSSSGIAEVDPSVSQELLDLQKAVSDASPDQVLLPSELLRGRPLDTPVRAAAERTVRVDGVPQVQWLVHWASDVGATPTWAPKAELVQDYPHLHLEGKVIPDEGGVDRDMFAETANEGNQRESEDEEESTSHEPDRGEQREDRHSKRIRKPPVRYGDFI